MSYLCRGLKAIQICEGSNCSAENGIGHSKECISEHNKAVHYGAGNRNPHARYRGYTGEGLWKNANDDEKAAWIEGDNARFKPTHQSP